MMSRVEQPVAEVQFQQYSHSYVVRMLSHRALVHAIFRGSAQDHDVQVYPSGLNGRGYHLRSCYISTVTQ